MAGEYFLNFRNKFTKILPQNIKLEDILTKEELDDEKIKSQFQSIFNVLADTNRDGEIDANEVNELIRYFDGTNDNKLSQEEINSTSRRKKFNPKKVKLFLERIHSKINNVSYACAGDDTYNGCTDGDFKMSVVKYSDNYIVYDTTTGGKNRQAFFDIENDALLNSKCDKQVQIVGMKAFQELLEKKRIGTPKLVIQNSDGTTSEIKIRFNIDNINDSIGKGKDVCMHYLTCLINLVSDLPPEVLNDLTKNIKEFYIGDVLIKGDGEGEQIAEKMSLHPNNTKQHNYYETITLNPISIGGLTDSNVLVHEVGHAVDSNINGFLSYKNEEAINTFSAKMKEILGKDYYAFENPQEFYAEYYAYKHTTGDARESNELFRLLDESLNNGDPHGWKPMKEILENIKLDSEKINKQADAFKEKRLTADNQKDAIPLERINKFVDRESLFRELCKYEGGTLYEEIREIIYSNPELKNRYNFATEADEIEIIKIIRNFPEIKEDLEKFLTEYDKKAAALEQKKLAGEKARIELQKTPYDQNELNKIRSYFEKYAKDCGAQPLRFTRLYLEKNKERLEDLLNSPELQDLINKACKKYDIRTSNAPITPKVLKAFQNEQDIRSFLIMTKEWIPN